MSAETGAGWRADYPHIVLSPMRLVSPLRPQSLAEVFTKYCSCKDTDYPCCACHHRATPRGTPRMALSELKTGNNIFSEIESSSPSSRPRSAKGSSQSSTEVTPRKRRSNSISPSPKAASPLSCSTPNSCSSRSRGLVRTKSGKRSFSQSGSPLPHGERRRLEFKENQVGVEEVVEAGESNRTVSPFKRKRPPKLHIPSTSESEVSGTAPKISSGDVPALEVSAEGTCYGMYSKKGHRDVMEDTYQAVPEMDGNTRQAFFGIFDGHGGRVAAEYVADNLSRNIREALNNGEEDLETAVRLGYLATDASFLQKQVSSGASCVTAFVRDGSLVVANAGDCRAVMSRSGVAVALTQDHRLTREDERRRVEELGAYVDCYYGVWRLQGTLAVSRGIGDLHLKQWVSAEPETHKLGIDPECEFLILASDGLWDVVSNQEAVDCIRSGICLSSQTGGLASLSKKLAQLAVNRGSRDDISVMVINLKQFC